MYSANQFLRRIVRAESPLFRFLKKLILGLLYPTVPVLPVWVRAPLRLLQEFLGALLIVLRWLRSVFYANPMFQARCSTVGRGLVVERRPFVTGPVEIHLGENVKFSGNISILSGGIIDSPRLEIRDRSSLGWAVTLVVNREVVIEEDVLIAPNCRISDTDGHPREADLRAAGQPPKEADILPVRIARYAWLGAGVYVMKGVTIGEGAIIAANSVVMTNVPPYSLAVGNPAEVMFRNYGRPSTYRKPPPNPSTGPGEDHQRKMAAPQE